MQVHSAGGGCKVHYQGKRMLGRLVSPDGSAAQCEEAALHSAALFYCHGMAISTHPSPDCLRLS